MTCLVCHCLGPSQFPVELITETTCNHKNAEMGYGFRSAWCCKGIGVYFECECGAMNYSLEEESCVEEEIEWYKNSPWSKGWVKEIKNEL